MKKRIIRRQSTSILQAEHLHPILARVYANRHISTVEQLETELKYLLPFHTLTGIDTAVDILVTAIQQQQKLMIIGDFDADGATSTVVAIKALKSFGYTHTRYLVPNRFAYGYGLTPEIVEEAHKNQPDIIMTVDNGIANHDGVIKAKDLGMKVIITDHHLAANTLPAADAIVNPNQPNDKFASKNLAGVGVVFYLMLALRARLRKLKWFSEQGITEPNMAVLLDLVALGTVADVVPLDKNNRILVKQGLRYIRAGHARPGINALLHIAKREPHNLVASDLGFAVGPRLNAAGRLEDMSIGIECLLSDEDGKARLLAAQLDQLNQERREIESTMRDQAFKILDKLTLDESCLPLGICLYDQRWHQGVVGILASRIKDRYHRPVIAFAKVSEQEIKGSARSIAGLHIRDVLAEIDSQHPKLINKFGGHAMAAGLSLSIDNYQTFADVFAKTVAKHINMNSLDNIVHSDGELSANDFTLELAETLRNSGPWGQDFQEPVFDGQFQLVEQRLVGGNHLKLTLKANGQPDLFDAIAFNVAEDEWPNHRATHIKAAYRLDVNEFRGNRNLQLIIEYLEAV